MKRILHAGLFLCLAFAGCLRPLPAQQFDRTYAPSSETVDYGQLPLQCPGGICPIQPPSYRPPAIDAGVKVPREIVAASVRVNWSGDGKQWKGSGTVFHVASGLYADDPTRVVGFVLTNNHVAPHNRGRVSVDFPGGGSREALWVATSDNADLSILCVAADASTPFIPLASATATRGEAVWQVGYPGGNGPIPRQGQARGKEGIAGRQPRAFATYGFTVQSAPGDSGSGMFRQSDGKLCAVLWGGAPGRGSQAVGVEDVHALVEKYCVWIGIGGGTNRPPAKPRDPYYPGLPPLDPSPKVPVAPVRPDPAQPIVVPGPAGPQGPPGPAGPSVQGPPGPEGKPAPLEKVKAAVEKAEEALAKVGPVAGWASTLPWIAGGAVAGPVGIGLAAFAILGKFAAGRVARRKEAEASGGVSPPVQPGQVQAPAPADTHPSILGRLDGLAGGIRSILDFLGKLQPAVAQPSPPAVVVQQPAGQPQQQPFVVVQAPSAPQVVRTESQYVPYEVTSPELAALKSAMDELVKRSPGNVDAVETIKGMAAQILSGMHKQPK